MNPIKVKNDIYFDDTHMFRNIFVYNGQKNPFMDSDLNDLESHPHTN